MKKLLVLVFCIAWGTARAVPLVNDRAVNPQSEDSLSIAFWATDSLGLPVSADSVFVVVTGPDGVVTFGDTLTVSDARVATLSLAGASVYTFSEQVSHLTGNGSPGVYSLILMARATVSPNRLTVHRMQFQVVDVSLAEQLALIDDSVYVRGGSVDSNRTELGVYGAGEGAYARTLIVVDTSAAIAIPGASIVVRNLSQTTVAARGWSDLDGRLDVNLAAGSLLVAASCPGYVFAAYDTIVVEDGGVDTLAASAWQPDAPPGLFRCRVWGYVFDISGMPEVGAEISVTLTGGPAQCKGIVISPLECDTTTDSRGFFCIDLIPTTMLVPTDTEYEMTVRRADGAILRRRFTVPEPGSWQFTW